MRYILVNKKTGLVTNAIEWDGDTSKWMPDDALNAILDTEGLAQPSDTLPDPEKLDSVVKAVVVESAPADVAVQAIKELEQQPGFVEKLKSLFK